MVEEEEEHTDSCRRSWHPVQQHKMDQRSADIDGDDTQPFPPPRKFGLQQRGKREQSQAPKSSALLDKTRAGKLKVSYSDVVGRLLFNFRDLAHATKSGHYRVGSNRVFRTACISRGDVDVDDVASIIGYIKVVFCAIFSLP